MATVLEQSTPTAITRTERTWRATLDTPKGQSYRLSVHREIAITDENDALITPTARAKDYVWAFDAIKDKKISAGGMTVTVEQLAGLLGVAFDQLVADQKAADALIQPKEES